MAAERRKSGRYRGGAEAGQGESNALIGFPVDGQSCRAIAKLCDLLPRDVQQQPEVQRLRSLGRDHAVLIAHMIYRRTNYETESKDYEFSCASMLEHWRMLRSSPWLQPLADDLRVRVFDLTREGGAGKEDVS